MRSKGSSRQSKLRQYISAPKNFLAKARDFYVKSMIEFDARIAYGSNMMMLMPLPAPQVCQMPKDFGTSMKKTMKNDQNLKELYRSICAKNEDNYNRGGLNERNNRVDPFDGMFRRYSVGIGRMGTIDEDEPCYFREEEIIMKSEILFPTFRR